LLFVVTIVFRLRLLFAVLGFVPGGELGFLLRKSMARMAGGMLAFWYREY